MHIAAAGAADDTAPPSLIVAATNSPVNNIPRLGKYQCWVGGRYLQGFLLRILWCSQSGNQADLSNLAKLNLPPYY
jgi:hypothetical protein